MTRFADSFKLKRCHIAVSTLGALVPFIHELKKGMCDW